MRIKPKTHLIFLKGPSPSGSAGRITEHGTVHLYLGNEL